MALMLTRLLILPALLASGVASAATWYVAPDGKDSAAGTQAAPWQSIARAQEAAAPGDTVLFRGGRYVYTAAVKGCATRTDSVDAVLLNKSGSEGQPIRYWAYPGETPVFDFSAMKDDCRVKGFNVSASWLHIKGLELTGAPQQPQNRLNHESWGIWVNGSHNVFEQLNTHHHMGPGLFIKDGGYNLVLNSDSHHNYDPYTSNGAGQSADGFGAHVKAGQPGNVFRGCRAWDNTDDGFDLINAFSPVVIENSWAWGHGYLPGTRTPLAAGNGNGIKAGGYGGKYVPNGVQHTVRNSIAFDNKAAGFYANHHPLALEFTGNIAFANGANFNMRGITPDGAAASFGILRNNRSYGDRPNSYMEAVDAQDNSWNLPQTLPLQGWDAPRQADGSLPALPWLSALR